MGGKHATIRWSLGGTQSARNSPLVRPNCFCFLILRDLVGFKGFFGGPDESLLARLRRIFSSCRWTATVPHVPRITHRDSGIIASSERWWIVAATTINLRSSRRREKQFTQPQESEKSAITQSAPPRARSPASWWPGKLRTRSAR